MDPLLIAGIVLGLALPIGIYLVRESRYKNPAARWPALAASLGFSYAEEPPRLSGRWKEREILLTAVEGGAVLSCALRPGGAFRVEAGPKELLEKEAGMVVPDRVRIPDSALDAKLLVRAQPEEAGAALDLNVLRRLLDFPGARVLANPGRADLRLSEPPSEAAQVRQAADIVVALADSLDPQ